MRILRAEWVVLAFTISMILKTYPDSQESQSADRSYPRDWLLQMTEVLHNSE